jgi:type IX secretion system PorP/SprF family membrane protein
MIILCQKTYKFYKMKKIFFVVLIVWLPTFGQQDSQFTQYMYNTININPAYAGSRDVFSVFGLHRNQWVGLDGAPVTNTFAFHSPLNYKNLGMGMSIMNDRIGPSDESSVSVDVSYTVPTSSRYKLALGLKATGHFLNVDFTKLNIYNPGDILAQNNIDNRFSPNVGAGIYFYSDNTYFGLSVPNFLETQHFDRGQPSFSRSSVASERMHYYFIMGKVFDISPEVVFKPALLSKIVEGTPLQMDVSANFLFNQNLTLGIAYRWNAAASMLAGFQVTSNWFIGYAYDMETTRLASYNAGSHEFFLRYEFNKKSSRVINPRFF